MLDHYPYNPLDYNAAVAELRNIREQQENFYWRNRADIEEPKQSSTVSVIKKQKSNESFPLSNDAMTRIMIESYERNRKDTKSSASETNRDNTFGLFEITVVFLLLCIFFLIFVFGFIKAVSSIL